MVVVGCCGGWGVRIANNVDPDQAAPREAVFAEPALFAQDYST